jgi:hypothetical protein
MAKNGLKSKHDSTLDAEAFADAEASLRIEGLDPAGRPHYEAIKAKVIAGTLTFDEAIEALKEHHSVAAKADREFAATA